MPRPLGSDTIIRVRAPLVLDTQGNYEYRDWDNAVNTPIAQCNVQPFPMAEKLNFEEGRDREFARTAIRIYAPPASDLQSTDRIVYNGDTYDVFGHPGDWHRFSGEKHHVSIIARRREG